jgi:hypothetical protein
VAPRSARGLPALRASPMPRSGPLLATYGSQSSRLLEFGVNLMICPRSLYHK